MRTPEEVGAHELRLEHAAEAEKPSERQRYRIQLTGAAGAPPRALTLKLWHPEGDVASLPQMSEDDIGDWEQNPQIFRHVLLRDPWLIQHLERLERAILAQLAPRVGGLGEEELSRAYGHLPRGQLLLRRMVRGRRETLLRLDMTNLKTLRCMRPVEGGGFASAGAHQAAVEDLEVGTRLLLVVDIRAVECKAQSIQFSLVATGGAVV